MTMEPTRARFDALMQIIAEQQQQGNQPSAAWLDEISHIATVKPEWFPPVPPVAPAAPPAPPSGAPPRAAQPLKPGERVPIIVDEDIERVSKEVLAVWGYRVCVFQAGGKLFEIQIDARSTMKFLVCTANTPRLLQVGTPRVRSLAARECRFASERLTKDGTTENVECLPPEWLSASIASRPSFENIPVLSALVCAPTLRSDGELIWERGYDESTGIYLASDLKVDVPMNPTQADAIAAMTKLLDLVSDFDFVSPAGKSVWVAGLLSLAARHTFNGPVPITIIDASKRGSGKTTLADIASIVATGNKAPRMFYTEDDVEMDKRITALALAGEQTVLIDNIVGKLASPPLDAALTSDAYKGRVLGKSEMTPAMPMKIVWFATGNGMTIGADTARRALLARLEPMVDRPEDRVGPRPGQPWKYPRLMNYVTENRTELLSCALTVVKAYIQAGRPQFDIVPMGSFEEWSATIRSAIIWSGAEDPCLTVKDAREADTQDHALRAMIECWPVENEVEVTAASLIKLAEMPQPNSAQEMWKNALLEWLPARGSAQLPTARDLGYALRAIKGSIVGNYKIDANSALRSGIPWRRVKVGEHITPITEEKGNMFQSFTVVR